MHKKIKNFLKKNKGIFKELDKIDLFLNIHLGVKTKLTWKFDGKISNIYEEDIYETYINYRVLVYFPSNGLRIDMSLDNANKITPVRVILENTFKEKSIQCKFYCYKISTVIDGPKLIILDLPLDSIYLDDGQSLLEKLKISDNFFF